jgi:hypothetical protein
MKLVLTYDIINVDALEKEYRHYLAERKDMLEYYEEIGDSLRKEKYEKDNPWMNFEEFVKETYFHKGYGVEELADYDLISDCEIELKEEV